MKSRTVLYILGLLTMLIGVMMLIPGIVSAMYKEPLSIVAFGLTSAVTLVSGMTMKYLGRGQNNGDKIEPKEAFAAVSIGWILAAFFGSLPFIFWEWVPLTQSSSRCLGSPQQARLCSPSSTLRDTGS
jgi:trk system potassium uptake protein TrkH